MLKLYYGYLGRDYPEHDHYDPYYPNIYYELEPTGRWKLRVRDGKYTTMYIENRYRQWRWFRFVTGTEWISEDMILMIDEEVYINGCVR